MLCIEIKWWDPATIVQFFLPAFSSYSQPGMLRKAIAKSVSCGMESLIGNRTNFLHGCPQRRESPNSTLAFPSDGVKKRREPGETIASISHTWMKQREFFFAAQPEEEGSDWHSDFAASLYGREVFCSHYSPMVLVIDSAFNWLWQRIKVSLSII